MALCGSPSRKHIYIFTIMPVYICTMPSPQESSIICITSVMGSNSRGNTVVLNRSFHSTPKNVPINGAHSIVESPP